MLNASLRIQRLAVSAALALVLAIPGLLGAQAGRIGGTITDQATGAALEGARVVIVGTPIIETSNQEGKYLVRSIAPGTYQVRALRIGYKALQQSVTVGPNETAALDFALTNSPVQLDEIVTTATGEQRKLEVGNTVSTIDVGSIAEKQPITEIGDLLSGRAAGVQVLKSSGTAGTGTRIRIRGSNSISLSNEPLYYIDGIRMESGSSSLSIDLAGQSVSRINDINPDEIESIEIVKGPAAATLYGIQAANGVVRITTKRGRAGRPRWNVFSELGVASDNNKYPLNYFGRCDTGTLTASTARRARRRPIQPWYRRFCTIQSEIDGLCTQTSVLKYSPLEDPKQRPYKAGLRQQYGANVSGGNDLVTYFLSGEYESEDGVFRLPQVDEDSINALVRPVLRSQIRPNAEQKASFRANLGANVSKNADIQASVGYVSSDTRLVENDNSFLTDRRHRRGEQPAARRSERLVLHPGPAVRRAGDPEHRAVHRRPHGQLAACRLAHHPGDRRLRHRQPDRHPVLPDRSGGRLSPEQLLGLKQNNRSQISQTSVDLAAVARFKPSTAWSSKTSIGGQFFRDLRPRTSRWARSCRRAPAPSRARARPRHQTR